MKLSKREKNSYIIWFLFNIVFFVLLIYFLFWKYQDYKIIEETKADTIKLINQLNKLNQKWLSFWDFQKWISSSEESDIKKDILLKVDKDFYDDHFTNTWSISYKNFLDKVSDYATNLENSSDYIDELLSYIMPTYTDSFVKSYDDKDGITKESYVTKYDFINYLERLSYVFWLDFNRSSSDIKLSTISWEEDSDKPLNYFDLSMKVRGLKWNIINFIHFFENVWWVKIWLNNNIVLYDDDFLTNSSYFKISLDSIIWKEDKEDDLFNNNIYKNIFAEITSIDFDWYPDPDNNPYKEVGYMEKYLKDNYYDEETSINISIRMYFKWISKNDIKAYAESFLEDYDQFKSSLEEIIKEEQKKDVLSDKLFLNKIRSILLNLDSYDKEITSLKNSLKDMKNTEEIIEKINYYTNLVNIAKNKKADLDYKLNNW